MVKGAIASLAKNRLSLVTGKRAIKISSRGVQASGKTANLQIREARTRDEKEKLYHFRYQFSNRGSSGYEGHVNHFCKRIKDDLDVNATNLIALRQGAVVGGIRINYAWRCALGVHADFYRMRETAGASYPSSTCLINWLMVDPDFRGHGLGYRLCEAAYRHALWRDASIAFLHCGDDLIFYFSALGFKAYMGRTWHRERGHVVPMKLDLLDETYLMKIGSPLLPVLRGWKQAKQPSVEIVPV